VNGHDVTRLFRDRWRLLVTAALLAAIAAYGYTKLPGIEPRWQSSILLQAKGRLDYGSFLALEKELRPLAEEVRQLAIMREVNQHLHTDLDPRLMLERTKVEPVVDSGQIRIDVEDPDPRRAEQISLEVADVYTRQHNAAEQGKLREERVILSTLDRDNTATLIWPLTRVIVPAAAVLGLIVGAAIVLLQAYLDESIRSAADVQQYLELPVLAMVPGRVRLSSRRKHAIANVA
jgi:capsular polysaccharide biosynthesis protein